MPFGTYVNHGSELKPGELRTGGAPQPERPVLDSIFKRAERSLVVTGLVIAPAAQAQICIIPGFRDSKQWAIYRVDWLVHYDSINGVAHDMQLAIGGVPYMVLPIPGLLGPAIHGTVYVAPNGADVEIDAIKGGASTYGAMLTMTRLVDGERIG